MERENKANFLAGLYEDLYDYDKEDQTILIESTKEEKIDDLGTLVAKEKPPEKTHLLINFQLIEASTVLATAKEKLPLEALDQIEKENGQFDQSLKGWTVPTKNYNNLCARVDS